MDSATTLLQFFLSAGPENSGSFRLQLSSQSHTARLASPFLNEHKDAWQKLRPYTSSRAALCMSRADPTEMKVFELSLLDTVPSGLCLLVRYESRPVGTFCCLRRLARWFLLADEPAPKPKCCRGSNLLGRGILQRGGNTSVFQYFRMWVWQNT